MVLVLAEFGLRIAQPIPSDQLLPLSYDVEALDRLSEGGTYVRFDHDLGWVTAASTSVRADSTVYQTNAAGQRAEQEYSLEPPSEGRRLAAFGDSLTHCDEVDFSDCWTVRLEEEWPGAEVMNFGVQGYGVDQAWLRYRRDGRPYLPCAVLIDYFVENINRVVNRFRPFYSPTAGIALSKPRFLLDGDGLRLKPNPTTDLAQLRDPSWVERELGPDDAWYFPGTFAPDPLNTFVGVRIARSASYNQRRHSLLRGESLYPLYEVSPEAVKVVERVLLGFAAEVERNGATPIVVFFGGRRDSTDAAVDDIPEPYTPIVARLNEAGVATIDLADVIVPEVRRRGTERLFEENGHYSPQGNRLIASMLAERLPDLVTRTCGD
jgi:hypothetical protein